MLEANGYLEILGKQDPDHELSTELKNDHPEVCQVVPSLCKPYHPRIHHKSSLNSVDFSKVEDSKMEFYNTIKFGGRCGTSVKSLAHLAQLFNSDNKFTKFDYGYVNNYQVYGQMEAPQIDITRMEVPVGMFVGSEDEISNARDCGEIKQQLGDKVVALEVLEGEDHLTMTISNTLTYFSKVIKVMNLYSK